MATSTIYQHRLKLFTEQVTVYPVSCEKLCNGRSDRQWLEQVLQGGAKIVQLRDKISDDRTVYEKALFFRKKTAEAGALFIVNNRLDIALMSDADGLHLGNSDIPAEEARRLAPNLIIGVSANTLEQAANAEKTGASYFNIGPLFKTSTKSKLTPFLSESAIPEFSKKSPLPFTVMGGIKLEHVEKVVKNGAQRIAVVTALTQAKDIADETRQWISTINNHL